jgi:hypothetical protein
MQLISANKSRTCDYYVYRILRMYSITAYSALQVGWQRLMSQAGAVM